MGDSDQGPKIVDYGGRRTRFDRRMEIEVSKTPEKRTGKKRRSGYDRRSVENTRKRKVDVERRSFFKPFLNHEDPDLDDDMIKPPAANQQPPIDS